MNVFTGIGNLGGDAEIREAGTAQVASFNVGIQTGYGDKATTMWVRCSMFGTRGVAVQPHLKKGTQVAISGELSSREFESNGVKKTSIECKVSELKLLGAKKASGEATAKAEVTDDDDGSLPF